MSKLKHFGTTLDRVYSSTERRVPGYQVCIWNPNRTTIQDVVLERSESPRYDISAHVKRVEFEENIVFENSEDAVATHCTITLARDPNAEPIPIDERTLFDGVPIRVYQGDQRVPKREWIILFTGVIRGNPAVVVHDRANAGTAGKEIRIVAVDRAEKYCHKIITGRSYDQGDDIGKVVVETAIEFMSLDRREIDIGDQNYALGHEQSQVVDIEALKALHQMLQCVGKKPRFNAEGKLVAADTDLSRAPVRVYETRDLFISIGRTQQGSCLYNCVKLLGLDNELTEVVERKKQLAHGEITTGWFDSVVRDEVWFSENGGKDVGGRKAKDTEMTHHLHGMGDIGAELEWTPELESDGYTCFGGRLHFTTGYAPEIALAITITYAGMKAAQALAEMYEEWEEVSLLEATSALTLVAALYGMMAMGRITWKILGYPFQSVYQQLCATAQLSGILSEDIRELEIRNDWLYDITVMNAMAKELLKREICKGWCYEIVMMDDPLLECDDIIEVCGERYYVTSIRKSLTRPGDGVMALTCWRIK